MRKWLVTLLIAIVVYLVVVMKPHPGDFHVYYQATTSLLSGRIDLYAPDFGHGRVMDYRYPPIFLFLFLPFGLLPYSVAVFAWSTLTVLLVAAAIFAYRDAFFRNVSALQLRYIFLLPALLSAKYVLSVLKLQNVHLIVLSLVILSFCALGTKKLSLSALSMGAAISVKVFPLLLLPYAVIRRQWRFLLLTFGFTALLTVAPSLYFGFSENLSLDREWFEHVILEPEWYKLNGPPDVSVQGQLERFFTGVDYGAREGDTDYRNVNIMTLPRETVRRAGLALSLVIITITFGTVGFIRWKRRLNGDHETNLVLLEFGALISMILLAAPRTNVNYLSALFIPWTILVYMWLNHRSKAILSALIISAMVTIAVPLVPGAQIQRLFLVLGLDVLAVFSVWLASLFVLLKYGWTPDAADAIQCIQNHPEPIGCTME